MNTFSDILAPTGPEEPADSAGRRAADRYLNARFLQLSRDKSDRVQALVSGFEETHGVSLDVLETTTVFVCRQCEREISRGKFKKGRCKCGESIMSPSDAEQIPLAVLAPAVCTIWDENTWLEEGIAYQFRVAKYDAQTGLQVLGGSGVDHELDVIAERRLPAMRVFCECKHRGIKPNDVLVFAGKLRDIGGQASIMFTTTASVDEAVLRTGTRERDSRG